MTPEPRNDLANSRNATIKALFPPALHNSRVLDRARTGDSVAFDILFNRHKDAIYRLLWHLLDGKNELVEEVVGTVFLAAYCAIGKFRAEAAFETWLYRIAIREASARRQKTQKKLFVENLLSFPDYIVANYGYQHSDAATTQDPLESLLQSEQNRRLHAALGRLPEPYRTPIMLRYLNEKDNREIATVLQRPEGTVRYQISRGLKLLAERLENGWTG